MYLNRGKRLNSELFYFIDLLIYISFVSAPFAITTHFDRRDDRMHPIFIPPIKE
jgi:hypothetical protein